MDEYFSQEQEKDENLTRHSSENFSYVMCIAYLDFITANQSNIPAPEPEMTPRRNFSFITANTKVSIQLRRD